MTKNRLSNIKKGREYVNILGINVLVTRLDRVIAGVEDKLSHNIKFSILTPNPELVLSSTQDLRLKEALNSADYAIPDGIGLAQAAKYLSLPAPKNIILRSIITFYQGLQVGAATLVNRKWLTDKLNIIPGRKLFDELIKLAAKKHWKVFLLGGLGQEAELATRELCAQHPKLRIQFDQFIKLDQSANPVTKVDIKLQKDVIDKINKFAPDLLFVAFGNPKQEIWIHKNLSKLNVGGAMAVGGTFRYVAGLAPLPPKWMEKAGLEWVYRLFTESYRIKRIFNAFPIFPLKVFWSKLTSKQ